MMRLCGIILLFLMSVLTGCIAAGGLKRRAAALKQVRLLIEELRLMIRYEALEVSQIALRLEREDKLCELEFIPPLAEYARTAVENGEMTFKEAWERAVNERPGNLSGEDIGLLLRVGGCLGSCDCEGQISELILCGRQADELCLSAQEQYSAKGRLYRSLGAIAGALIAIIAV